MLVLTPGNTADCVMAEACVSRIPGVTKLLADKGYDTDAFRAFLKDNDIKAVIPGKSNRKKRIRHDKKAYKGRNVVERCFCEPAGQLRTVGGVEIHQLISELDAAQKF